MNIMNCITNKVVDETREFRQIILKCRRNVETGETVEIVEIGKTVETVEIIETVKTSKSSCISN